MFVLSFTQGMISAEALDQDMIPPPRKPHLCSITKYKSCSEIKVIILLIETFWTVKSLDLRRFGLIANKFNANILVKHLDLSLL